MSETVVVVELVGGPHCGTRMSLEAAQRAVFINLGNARGEYRRRLGDHSTIIPFDYQYHDEEPVTELQ